MAKEPFPEIPSEAKNDSPKLSSMQGKNLVFL